MAVLTLIKLRRLRVVLEEALVDDVDLARPLFSIVGRRGQSLPLGVLEAIDGYARGASHELEQAQLALRRPRAARQEPLDHPVRHLEPAVVGEPRQVVHVDPLHPPTSSSSSCSSNTRDHDDEHAQHLGKALYNS